MSEKTFYIWLRGEAVPINAHEARSIEANISEGTWTFKIDEDCRVGAGDYLLVSCEDLRKLATANPTNEGQP